jgi:tetratricopeptide (TPR) repeat protein
LEYRVKIFCAEGVMDISSSLEDARNLIKHGKKKEARSLLREIAQTDPNNEETYILFAQVAEKHEHAIYSLEQALKINPNNLRVRNNLASLRTTSKTNWSKRLNTGVFVVLILIFVALLAFVVIIISSDSSSPSDDQLNTINEEVEYKFGFTEAERKEIWDDMIRAEDRADVEALQAYPDMTPLMDWRYLFDELSYKYKFELAQRLGLSMEQLKEIGFEATEKGWPFPPLP